MLDTESTFLKERQALLIWIQNQVQDDSDNLLGGVNQQERPILDGNPQRLYVRPEREDIVRTSVAIQR